MSEKKPDMPMMRNIAPFGLRMQPDLKSRVEEAAAKAGRSMNSELVHRVEAYDEHVEAIRGLELELRDQWKLLEQLRPSDPLEMADDGAKLLLDENRAWRNAALEAQKAVADLQQKLAETTQALHAAQKPDPAPALTPEAFDAMLAPRIDQAVESAFRKYVRERTERERKD